MPLQSTQRIRRCFLITLCPRNYPKSRMPFCPVLSGKNLILPRRSPGRWSGNIMRTRMRRCRKHPLPRYEKSWRVSPFPCRGGSGPSHVRPSGIRPNGYKSVKMVIWRRDAKTTSRQGDKEQDRGPCYWPPRRQTQLPSRVRIPMDAKITLCGAADNRPVPPVSGPGLEKSCHGRVFGRQAQIRLRMA